MPRVKPLEPASLTGAQRTLYQALTSGPRASGPQAAFPVTDRAGQLTGPFDLMLRAPELGQALQEVGSTLRFASSLTPRIRETVILEVAAFTASGFEWSAHERVARRCGLTAEEISQLKHNSAPRTLARQELEAWRLARHLLAGRAAIAAETYDYLAETLGTQGIVELIALTGYYRLLSDMMRVFEVGTPEDWPDDGMGGA